MNKTFTRWLALLAGVILSVGAAWGDVSVPWTPTSDDVTNLNANTADITVGTGSNVYHIYTSNALKSSPSTSKFSAVSGQSYIKVGQSSDMVVVFVPTTSNDITNIEVYASTYSTRKAYYNSSTDGTKVSSNTSTTASALAKNEETPYTPWSGTLAKGTYYAFGGQTSGSGDVYIHKVVVTFKESATEAPADPTFSPEGGNVDGGSSVTIASTGATSIKYQLLEAAATLTTESDGWKDYSESVTLPNVTGTRYLYAYATNSVGNSAVASATYSITKAKTTPKLTFSPAELTATIGDESVTEPTLTTNPEGLTVTYSIADGGTGTTINATTGKLTLGSTAGTATITATYAGNDDYNTATATYTLKIKPEAYTELVAVTEATTWDLKATVSPDNAKAEDLTIVDNIEAVTMPSGYVNGTLAVSTGTGGKLVSGKYFQAQELKFKAGVRGTVSVTYSNTGSKTDARIVAVNGTALGSGSKNSTQITESTLVDAGDVSITITGTKTKDFSEMGNFTKIVFEPQPEGVAIDPTITIDNTKTTVEVGATVTLADVVTSNSTGAITFTDSENNAVTTFTPAAAGTYTFNYSQAAVEGEYNAAEGTITIMAQAPLTAVTEKTWNFSDWTAETFSTGTSVRKDDLEVNATSKDIAIDGSKKSIDGYNFTQRLKFGGGGDKDKQNVHFKVAGKCKITLYGTSSSNNTERIAAINIGGEEVATLTNDGSSIGKVEYNYSGSEADVYIYCKSGGFNLYAIVVGPITLDPIQDVHVNASGSKVAISWAAPQNAPEGTTYTVKVYHKGGTLPAKASARRRVPSEDNLTYTAPATTDNQVEISSGSSTGIFSAADNIEGLSYSFTITAEAEGYEAYTYDSEDDEENPTFLIPSNPTQLAELAAEGITVDGAVIRNAAGLEVRLYDAQGRMLRMTNADLDFTTLPQGLYIIRCGGQSLKVMR